jgi:hypothetical protein
MMNETKLTLAVTWSPRGELSCFERSLCLIVGRSENAYRTHPRSLRQTEQMRVASGHDAEPENWENRVGIAEEIMHSAIQAFSHSFDLQEGK